MAINNNSKPMGDVTRKWGDGVCGFAFSKFLRQLWRTPL